MSNLYVWMVLHCDMWHNKNVTRDMFIEFVPIDLGG
jgi:hypothetical protein